MRVLASPDPAVVSVTWRQPSASMWVAEQHGGLVATIEQVSDFVVTNPSGDVTGTYPTLSDAKGAVEYPVPPAPRQASFRRQRRRLLVRSLSGALAATGVLILGTLLVTGMFR